MNELIERGSGVGVGQPGQQNPAWGMVGSGSFKLGLFGKFVVQRFRSFNEFVVRQVRSFVEFGFHDFS